MNNDFHSSPKLAHVIDGKRYQRHKSPFTYQLHIRSDSPRFVRIILHCAEYTKKLKPATPYISFLVLELCSRSGSYIMKALRIYPLDSSQGHPLQIASVFAYKDSANAGNLFVVQITLRVVSMICSPISHLLIPTLYRIYQPRDQCFWHSTTHRDRLSIIGHE